MLEELRIGNLKEEDLQTLEAEQKVQLCFMINLQNFKERFERPICE